MKPHNLYVQHPFIFASIEHGSIYSCSAQWHILACLSPSARLRDIPVCMHLHPRPYSYPTLFKSMLTRTLASHSTARGTPPTNISSWFYFLGPLSSSTSGGEAELSLHPARPASKGVALPQRRSPRCERPGPCIVIVEEKAEGLAT